MISLCSCTGVSTSTLEISKKQGATASCKACGGKPLVNGRVPSTSSMPGAVGLELTRFVNSDLTWTNITKGNRSSSRRARKSLTRSLKNIAELVNKDPKAVDMPVSESEKLGVSVLGCRFSEKVEHVPIKKRRFMFRSPSPPPRVPSPHSEENGLLFKCKNDLREEFHPNPLVKSRSVAIKASSSMNDLGRIVDSEIDIGAKNLVRASDKADEAEDFSGISILAAAACSNSFGGDEGHVEESSGMEESFVCEGAFEDFKNGESCSLSKGISKEDQSSAEISKEGSGSCTSIMPAEELAASSRTANSSSNCLPQRHTMEGTSLQDLSMATSKDLLSKSDEGTVGMQESSSRDGRLHWDLNTVMDAWECPFDGQSSGSQTDVVVGVSEYGKSTCSDRTGNSEDKKIGSIKCDAEKETLSINSRDMVQETEKLNVEEHKLDQCTDTDSAICSQKGQLSSEIDLAPTLVSVHGTQSSHSLEGVSPKSGSVDLVPVDDALGLRTSADADRNALAQSVTSGSSVSSETLPLHQVGSLDFCSGFTHTRPKHCTSTFVSEDNSNAASVDITSMKSVDDNTAGFQTGEIISPGTKVDLQEPIALPCNSTCENENVNGVDAEGAEGASILDSRIAPTNVVGLEAGQLQESGSSDNAMKISAANSDEVGPSQSSDIFVELPTSAVLVGGQPAGIVDVNVQQGKVSVEDNTETGSQMHLDNGEPKSSEKSVAVLHAPSGYSDDLVNVSDKVSPEEPLVNNYVSDVCHDDGHLAGIEKTSEPDMDYDSQYEDGEVRESISHTWEDYDGEDVEAEHVDYGSDNTNTLSCEGDQVMKNTLESSFQPHPSVSLLTEVTKAGSGKESTVKTTTPYLRGQFTGKDASNVVGTSDSMDNKPGVSTSKVTRIDETDARGDDMRKAIQSASINFKMSGWEQSECHKNFSDTETGVRDGSSWKKIDGDCVDGFDAEDTEARMAESGVFKRDLRSRIEVRPSRDMLFGKDRLSLQGSRFSDADGLTPRFERESGSAEFFGRGRYSRHAYNRDLGGDRWVDPSESYRGQKRHHSPNYHATMNFRHVVSENGSHRSLRSRSPVGRDEAFGMRVDVRPAREISPYRRMTLGRGRSVRYVPQVDGRGPRGRYGPLPGNFRDSSFNHSHPPTRRERSFSPIERRGNTHAHQFCTKSPSRSRTRSPISGNSGFRQRSKSPNFRSEIRMQRQRSPYQRPGFLADHVVGFRSMRRGRGSPPHNSRWIGDRREGVGHFREHGYNQRTSVIDRRFDQHDRFELVDAPRSYRPLYSGRLSDMDGVGRGSLRYGGNNDERRKHVYKYRSGNVGVRNDMDEPIKRIRYNVEGFVAARNSRYQDNDDFHSRGNPKDFNRGGIDSRIGDIPRRSGEGGPYEYQREGKYDVKSNPSAMWEGEEDSSPRKRPS
ncbi:uncharacterized protein LOC115971460 isoform X1 [Quercus lobata]|uniref:Dentin sialophosphoprotein n=2 Tax=Quercus lobata TaxID=97700 RepID=A0A7N2N7K1_QUELO|nr:uncharacterized protein LOC115971460 isoform X1 [Quercus lobata]XP_030947252.1 uncharacterized protein LOC115971460 isoform X1 [Quercus lobata]